MCPTGAIDPIKCEKHTYQNIMASVSCTPCPLGFFSGEGFEYCQPIPAGYQRDTDPLSKNILARCPEGKYSDWGFE
jgi:hypothetical protein